VLHRSLTGEQAEFDTVEAGAKKLINCDSALLEIASHRFCPIEEIPDRLRI
jgi:hypothetical protein